jgi:hypothetical protein
MICDVIKKGQPDVIYIPEDESLPAMIRVREYARMLGLSYYFFLKLCEERGVPISLAGGGKKYKIRMVSPKKFIEKMGGSNETIQDHL